MKDQKPDKKTPLKAPLITEWTGTQKHFFTRVQKYSLEVIVSFVTGEKIEGRIKSFDSYTIGLNCEGREGLIFKAGICSIFPKTENKGRIPKGRLRRVEVDPQKEVD